MIQDSTTLSKAGQTHHSEAEYVLREALTAGHFLVDDIRDGRVSGQDLGHEWMIILLYQYEETWITQKVLAMTENSASTRLKPRRCVRPGQCQPAGRLNILVTQ